MKTNKKKKEERKMKKDKWEARGMLKTCNLVVFLFSFFILLFSFACDNPFVHEKPENVTEQITEIDITIGDNGNWFINGVDTGVKAKGDDTQISIGENGNWFFNGVDTGIPATGEGTEITIGQNGNWFVNDVDTGIPAIGTGSDITIGDNGNWFVNGEDTGIPVNGGGLEITIGENGNWFINNIDTGIPANVVVRTGIDGVTVPKAGETPVTEITETEQFTGTVEWQPDHIIFETETIYTATIKLTSKTGYTLHNVAENFFDVTGADTTSNDFNSNIVTAVFPQTESTVTIAAIEGVTPPIITNIPVTEITETEQFTGTVTWSPDHSVFEQDIEYTATITLTPKEGFTFYGVSEDFFTVDGTIENGVTNAANSGVITAIFPEAAEPAIVNISIIEGVTPPETLAVPVTTITETEQFTGTVEWSGNPVTFAPNTIYTAIITLTPKPGYTFTGIAENFFEVEGADTVTNAENSGVITAIFPQTGPPVTVDIATIEGVTPPEVFAAPVTSITETEQFTGTVEWSGNPAVYAAYTVYTATITLTPKAGYTFDGIAEDFFEVEGADTVTNAADSGVITAIFPQTDIGRITDAAVTVTASVRGATPSTTASGSSNYTAGTVTWSPTAVTFAPGTVYTATVTLTANTGYSFTGLTTATINGNAATVSNNTGAAVTLSYTFPATEAFITLFTFCYDGVGQTVDINHTTKTITVYLPPAVASAVTMTSLNPNITHEGASISPTGAQNFTTRVDYTVTAANGSETTYTVIVNGAN